MDKSPSNEERVTFIFNLFYKDLTLTPCAIYVLDEIFFQVDKVN